MSPRGFDSTAQPFIRVAANERTRSTLTNGSYWQYVYDDLGQVSSGKRYSSTGVPIPGQQFEYTFDDIGNRTQAKAGGDALGDNLRTANDTSNLLNMYTSRGSPDSVDIMGYAPLASCPVRFSTGGSTVVMLIGTSRRPNCVHRESAAFRRDPEHHDGSSRWQRFRSFHNTCGCDSNRRLASRSTPKSNEASTRPA